MDTLMLCSYCLTTMQIQMSTVMMEEPHSILQHSMATLTFLGSYLSAVQRLMHRMKINLPHLPWRQNLGTSMLCDYCSTAMQMWKRVTMTVTPRCFVQHSIVNRRLYKYYWTE